MRAHLNITQCKVCKGTDAKKIYAKGMCRKCYSKHQRQTPAGIESTSKYNKGKGKEAQKRWRLKHFSPKEKQVLNKDKVCECGGVVKAKNLCMSCYHKKRNESKPRPEGYIKRKRGRPFEYKTISDKVFNELIELVSTGFTILQAIETVGCPLFYKHATDLQKIEIKLHKQSSGSSLLY